MGLSAIGLHTLTNIILPVKRVIFFLLLSGILKKKELYYLINMQNSIMVHVFLTFLLKKMKHNSALPFMWKKVKILI